MKRLLKFPTLAGPAVLVEIEEAESGGLVKASRADREAAAVPTALDDALAAALPLAAVAAGFLEQAEAAGLAVELAFGVRLTAEGEAILTPGFEAANFRLTVRRRS